MTDTELQNLSIQERNDYLEGLKRAPRIRTAAEQDAEDANENAQMDAYERQFGWTR
jgi:hypothetical protein